MLFTESTERKGLPDIQLEQMLAMSAIDEQSSSIH